MTLEGSHQIKQFAALHGAAFGHMAAIKKRITETETLTPLRQTGAVGAAARQGRRMHVEAAVQTEVGVRNYKASSVMLALVRYCSVDRRASSDAEAASLFRCHHLKSVEAPPLR